MSCVLVIGVGGGFMWFKHEVDTAPVISPLHTEVVANDMTPTPTPLASVAAVAIEISNAATLAEQVGEVTASVSGTFGIAVKNLNTGETYFERADETFTMASTFKTPLVIAALQDLESGKLKKDTKIGSFPIDNAMHLIIERSEEELAELLAAKLTWAKVENVARSLGMTKTKYINDFTTTPKDQLTLYENIYRSRGISQGVRDQIYSMLVNQKINDRLPKYLPPGTIVAHKTGELGGIRHDVGIVTANNTTYVVILMSKDLGIPEKGKEALAKLSYVFYRHFIEAN